MCDISGDIRIHTARGVQLYNDGDMCVTFQVISEYTLHLKIDANTSCIAESKEKKGTLSQIPVLIHIICKDTPSECAGDSSTTEG